jgi:hypothetical protein
VSSPEDIILSEHVEESLPRELCDIPWQFVVTVITCVYERTVENVWKVEVVSDDIARDNI